MDRECDPVTHDPAGPASRGLKWIFGTKTFMLAIVGLLVLATIFLTHFRWFFAPHYPIDFDQPDFIWHVYSTYFGVFIDAGTVGDRIGKLLALANFKGWTQEYISLFMLLVFGPSRTSLAATNALLFCLMGLAYFLYFSRLFRPRIGLLALGLLLLNNSLTMVPGGMADLRWDFPGLVWFGFAYLAFLNVIFEPRKRALAIFCVFSFLSISTRSITGVYLAVMTGFACVMVTSVAVIARSGYYGRRARALFLSGIAVVFSLAVMVGLFYRRVIEYYGGMIFTDEGRIRMELAGLSNKWELFSFYLDDLKLLFALPVLVAIGVLVVMLVLRAAAWRLRRARHALVVEQRPLLVLAIVAGASALVGVIGPLSLWSPSSIVAGVLTGPIVGTLTCLCGIADRRKPAGPSSTAGIFRSVAPVDLAVLAVFCAGALHFVLATSTAGISGPDLAYIREVDSFQETSVDDLSPQGGKVIWAAVTDWAGLGVLQIFLYEHGLPDLVPRFEGGALGIFAITAADFLREISTADIVVVNRDRQLISQQTYPLTASLAKSRGVWQSVLDREFVLRSEIHAPGSEIFGVYYRPVRLFGVLGAADATTQGRMTQFTLGQDPVILDVRNRASGTRDAMLEFSVEPAPSGAPETFGIVMAGTTVSAQANAATGWRVRQRLSVAPGAGGITLSLMPPPASAPPATPVEARVRVSGLTLTTDVSP